MPIIMGKQKNLYMLGGAIFLGLILYKPIMVYGGAWLKSLNPAAVRDSSLNPLQLLDPLPQDAQIQVYLNHSQAASYQEPYRSVVRYGDDLEQILVEAIEAAEVSVEVAIQELRLPKIAQALAQKFQAGIPVRVILENNYSHPWSDLSAEEVAQLDDREQGRYQEFVQLVDSNQDGQLSPAEVEAGDALVMLRQAGVPVIDDTADGSKGSGLMHHKFLVIDQKTVITTSANFTTSDVHGDFSQADSRGNPNSLLRISSPELAGLFRQEFDLMWGDGVGGKPDSLFGVKKPFRGATTLQIGNNIVTLQFSPSAKKIPWQQSSNGLINQTLAQATQRTRLALFVFSEQNLVNTLQQLHQAGGQIQVLIDSQFAYRPYSEGLDLLGVVIADEQCRYEEGNLPWQPSIDSVGTPRLPSGDVLHHKFGLVDDQVVITGSHNWSAAANQTNDETLLVIKNPIVAAHFRREFDRLYTNANLGIPARIQTRIQEQAAKCR
jgi:phosphatidylserine/phosphatidylglycerophosphate/cardiolipin synthase-like enzyme